jgi:hypothetical protein
VVLENLDIRRVIFGIFPTYRDRYILHPSPHIMPIHGILFAHHGCSLAKCEKYYMKEANVHFGLYWNI